MTTNPHEDDVLAHATQLLRQHTDAGWTAISANILDRALRAFRPSDPVRGRHHFGDFFIASDVVVARLRQAVDNVPHAAVTRITCSIGDHQQLADVTVQLIVAYGAHLLSVADNVHQSAARALIDILGDLAPSGTNIHTHVHIGDITDDPRDVT